MIYTIGHSNRSMESFVGMLKGYGISQVVDVRTVPHSRHNPQFNREELEKALESAGIAYVHMKELGGFRRPRNDSINLGWENDSFRGFADYMQTDGFAEGIGRLIEISVGRNIAMMCSEAVPWRCHRSLIADALIVRKISVIHVLSMGSCREHELTPFARIMGSNITYPRPE